VLVVCLVACVRGGPTGDGTPTAASQATTDRAAEVRSSVTEAMPALEATAPDVPQAATSRERDAAEGDGPVTAANGGEAEADGGEAEAGDGAIHDRDAFQEVVFTATIVEEPRICCMSEVFGGPYPAGALVVGPLARFLLVMHIDSIQHGTPILAVGTDRIFVIHSPAMTFINGPTNPGDQYRLKLVMEPVESGFLLITLAPDF
jgi:hypothetical protein